MAIMFEKKIYDHKVSKLLLLPKEWAENKETIGVIAFDLNEKEERRLFFEFKEKLIEIQD